MALMRNAAPTFAPFGFAGHALRISDAACAYWPEHGALLVADLHLEKGSWYAQRGVMLPPYDSVETLDRLQLAAKACGARAIYCLGDNFHDDAGPQRMPPQVAQSLAALAQAHRLVWITGNHDAGLAGVPGEVVDALQLSDVWLRHEALPGADGPEITGHFHPKLRLALRGRRLSRRCAVLSHGAGPQRMILPAFGAFTGGLDADSPAIVAALQPATSIIAVLAQGSRALHFPVWQATPPATNLP